MRTGLHESFLTIALFAAAVCAPCARAQNASGWISHPDATHTPVVLHSFARASGARRRKYASLTVPHARPIGMCSTLAP
jgi:hypothetical protein